MKAYVILVSMNGGCDISILNVSLDASKSSDMLRQYMFERASEDNLSFSEAWEKGNDDKWYYHDMDLIISSSEHIVG